MTGTYRLGVGAGVEDDWELGWELVRGVEDDWELGWELVRGVEDDWELGCGGSRMTGS